MKKFITRIIKAVKNAQATADSTSLAERRKVLVDILDDLAAEWPKARIHKLYRELQEWEWSTVAFGEWFMDIVDEHLYSSLAEDQVVCPTARTEEDPADLVGEKQFANANALRKTVVVEDTMERGREVTPEELFSENGGTHEQEDDLEEVLAMFAPTPTCAA